jgi:hypothetical protein
LSAPQLKEITSCYACGRRYIYSGPVGEDRLNGRFCSDNCRDQYDNGFPSYADNIDAFEPNKERLCSVPLERWKVMAGPPNSGVGSGYYKKGINMSKQLANSLNVSHSRIQRVEDKSILLGRRGSIHHDDEHLHVAVKADSIRKFSAIKRKLGFMELVTDEKDGGAFRLKRLPTKDEAVALRKVVGMNKSKLTA